jgi:hypothetical protein
MKIFHCASRFTALAVILALVLLLCRPVFHHRRCFSVEIDYCRLSGAAVMTAPLTALCSASAAVGALVNLASSVDKRKTCDSDELWF